MIKIVFFDFDGVFTDNSVYVSSEGIESVRCFRGDGLGLKLLKDHKIKSYIISSEVNNVVLVRGKKLPVCKTLNGINNKLECIKSILNELGMIPAEAAFVGNDWNDLPAMNYVGWSVCPPDAEEAVLKTCDYVTRRRGGYGCVRDFCEVLVSKL